MAALTWREVSAPTLSNRDMLAASAVVGDSFSRLGQVFADREKRLREEKTNDAVANAYMAGTPEEIAALRAGGLGALDKRVDRKAFAMALGDAESGILTRGKTREDLLNLQAEAQKGGLMSEIQMARFQGDNARADELMAQAANDALAKRLLGGRGDDFVRASDGFHDNKLADDQFGEEKSQNRFQNGMALRNAARADAEFAFRRSEAAKDRAERNAERTQLNSLGGLADSLARKHGTLNPTQFEAAVRREMAEKGLLLKYRDSVLGAAKDTYAGITTPLGTDALVGGPKSAVSAVGTVKTLRGQLTAAAARERAALEAANPGVVALQLSRTPEAGKMAIKDIRERWAREHFDFGSDTLIDRNSQAAMKKYGLTQPELAGALLLQERTGGNLDDIMGRMQYNKAHGVEQNYNFLSDKTLGPIQNLDSRLDTYAGDLMRSAALNSGNGPDAGLLAQLPAVTDQVSKLDRELQARRARVQGVPKRQDDEDDPWRISPVLRGGGM